MKTALFLCLLSLLFSSCLVVKIYENPETSSKPSEAPKEVKRKMIGSGKMIDLGNKGTQEILFFGNDETPKKFLFKEESIDDLEESPLLIVDGTASKTLHSITNFNRDEIESIKILKGEAAIKKYGAEGINGVIEIVTKKD